MTELEKIYRKLYPIGTKVAYFRTRNHNDKPFLGRIVGYSIYGKGYYYEDVYLEIEDCEFSEYTFDCKPSKDIKKVYYTQKACDKDWQNRAFL